MQDIVPRKSIRDIEKPKNIPIGVSPRAVSYGVPATVKAGTAPLKSVTSSAKYEHEEYRHIQNSERSGSRWWQYIFGLIVLGLVGAGTYLHLNKKVTVFVTPYTSAVTLQNTTLELPTKDILVIEEKKEIQVPLVSTGTKKVESKAQGTVTIFNTGSQPQLLIPTTRLQTPNGNVYRLDGRITVPPAKGSVAGSIEARVTADVVGNAYNVKIADFILPGLAGSPKFKQVYARTSKGIQGGASEIVPEFEQSIVDRVIAEAVTLAKKELEININTRVLSTSRTLAPIIWIVEKNIEASSAQVMVMGKMSTVDQFILATTIANEKQLLNLSQSATFVNFKKGTIDGFEMGTKTARIRMSGDIQLQARVLSADIQKLLAEKSFNQFSSSMKNINASKNARFTSKPFWVQSFPEANRIEVIVE